MSYILIRINNVYYLKDMETKELYNFQDVEDLRRIRDLINNIFCDIEPYKRREQMILEILNY